MQETSSCVLKPKGLDISQVVEEIPFRDLKIPEEARYRVPTMNRHGYMFTKFDPVTNRWLESIRKNRDQVLFEVGGAYGNVATAALEKGVKKYYLNDFEEKHLTIFANQLKQNKKEHLFSSVELIVGRCPDEVKLKDNCLDAILANKVLLFFTPDNIDFFVEWMRNGLKVGGCVYILPLVLFIRDTKRF